MTKTQREQIKNKIEEDLKTTTHHIELLQERTKPIAPDCALGRDIREETLQLQLIDATTLYQAEIRLNKLRYALQKVDKENYGVCLECEEEIAFARLLLLPESTYCVACKSELGL